MTKSAFEDIKAGMDEAIAFARDEATGAVVHQVEVVDVKAARQKLGMSQGKFAAAFGVSLPTLRKWEQRQRRPTGAARLLIKAIDAEPETMKRLLSIGG